MIVVCVSEAKMQLSCRQKWPLLRGEQSQWSHWKHFYQTYCIYSGCLWSQTSMINRWMYWYYVRAYIYTSTLSVLIIVSWITPSTSCSPVEIALWNIHNVAFERKRWSFQKRVIVLSAGGSQSSVLILTKLFADVSGQMTPSTHASSTKTEEVDSYHIQEPSFIVCNHATSCTFCLGDQLMIWVVGVYPGRSCCCKGEMIVYHP